MGKAPDLILLDIMIPEIDGYVACVKLKSHPMTKPIPVNFVTSQTDEINETLGYEYGSVDYIRKPISPSILVTRVKTHLALYAARLQLRPYDDVRKNIRDGFDADAQ